MATCIHTLTHTHKQKWIELNEIAHWLLIANICCEACLLESHRAPVIESWHLFPVSGISAQLISCTFWLVLHSYSCLLRRLPCKLARFMWLQRPPPRHPSCHVELCSFNLVGPLFLVTQCNVWYCESHRPVRADLCPAAELYFFVSCLVICGLTDWLGQGCGVLDSAAMTNSLVCCLTLSFDLCISVFTLPMLFPHLPMLFLPPPYVVPIGKFPPNDSSLDSNHLPFLCSDFPQSSWNLLVCHWWGISASLGLVCVTHCIFLNPCLFVCLIFVMHLSSILILFAGLVKLNVMLILAVNWTTSGLWV